MGVNPMGYSSKFGRGRGPVHKHLCAAAENSARQIVQDLQIHQIYITCIWNYINSNVGVEMFQNNLNVIIYGFEPNISDTKLENIFEH